MEDGWLDKRRLYMKAVRFYGIGNVNCDDIPIPTIGSNDVLIKVKYAGICGSDKHIFNKGMFVEKIPETMGHEFVGTIAKIGKNVSDFSLNDRVTANPMIYCGRCYACLQGMYNACDKLTFIGESRPGSFAEYISINAEKVIKIPEKLDLRTAVLCEPLAVAIHTMKRAVIDKTEKISIIGAGPIGMLLIAIARKIYDISDITVIDISTERLDFIKQKYPDINIQEKFFNSDKYDAIIDAAGSDKVFNEALEHIYPNGKLYVVSLSEKQYKLNINDLVNKQLKIIGCNGYDNVDIITALRYLSDRKLVLDFLISDEFDFTECKTAFELLMQSKRLVAKIIFKS